MHPPRSNRSIRRRQLTGAGLALGVSPAVLLAACAGRAGDGESPAAAPPGLRGTTVEYWSTTPPADAVTVAFEKIFESFNRQNTQGITVQTAGAQTNLEKLLGALAAGTPPDLTRYQNFYLAPLFAKGGLLDADTAMQGIGEWRRVRPSLYPNIVQGLSWKGQLFGVPTFSGGQLLYYSPAALQRVGLQAPPRLWSWDQFEDYARKAGQPPDVWGYIFGWQYSDLGNLALNNGGRLINGGLTAYTLNSPEVIQTVEWQLSLVKAGLAPPHDGSASGGYKELLPERKTVMQPAISARLGLWRQRPDVSLATGHNPQGPRSPRKEPFTHGSTHGFGIFRTDEKRSQGAALASLWVTRVDSGLALAEGGLQTPYRQVIESAEFQAQLKRDTDLWPFYEIMPNVLPFANGPSAADERRVIDEGLRSIWAGTVGARDGLNEMQRVAQGLLAESLRA